MKRTVKAVAPIQDAVPWSSFARSLAVVLLVVGVFAFFGFLTQAFQTLMMGFLFAFLLYRPIGWLGRRLRFRTSSAVFHFTLLVLLLAFIIWGLRFLSAQATEFEQALSLAASGSSLASLVAPLQATGIGGTVANAIRGLVSSMVGLIGVMFIAIIFSFWLTIDLHQARGKLVGFFTGDSFRQIGSLLRRLDQIWMGYLTAEIIFGLVMTVASLVEFWILGVPYFGLMAVLTGLLTLIPSVGGLISSLVVAIPCLVFGSTRFPEVDPVVFTVLVTVVNVLTTQIAYNFIAVPIVGRYVRLPAALVLISVLVGVGTGSFLLAFLIVPILASLRIGAGYLLSKSRGLDPYPGEASAAHPEDGLFSQLVAAPVGPASEPTSPKPSKSP